MANRDEAKVAIGVALQNLRGNRTRRAVADNIGVTPQTVYHWERGIRTPDAPSLALYAAAVDADFARLGEAVDLALAHLHTHDSEEE